MQTVFGVVVHIVQIQTRGRHEVIVGLLNFPDLVCEDGKRRHGEAGIVRGYAVIEGEVFLLFLQRVPLAVLRHGEDQVRLLADHVPIDNQPVIIH